MTIDGDLANDNRRFAKWVEKEFVKSGKIDAQLITEDSGVDFLYLADPGPELRQALTKIRLPRRRVFHLESDYYANYRLRREDGGTNWSVWVSGAEFLLGEEFMGHFASTELLDLVDGWGLNLEPLDYIRMGWRPS